MPQTPTERRVSVAIIGTILVAGLLSVGGVFVLIYTGRIETNLALEGTVSVSGAIPISYLFLGALAVVGFIIYMSLTGIYGTDHVRTAAEDATELAEDVSEQSEDSGE